MLRFLITCGPFTGHLYPQIRVALAPADRGRDVAVYSHASTRTAVEGEGLRLLPFIHVDEWRCERVILSRAPCYFSRPSSCFKPDRSISKAAAAIPLESGHGEVTNSN